MAPEDGGVIVFMAAYLMHEGHMSKNDQVRHNSALVSLDCKFIENLV